MSTRSLFSAVSKQLTSGLNSGFSFYLLDWKLTKEIELTILFSSYIHEIFKGMCAKMHAMTSAGIWYRHADHPFYVDVHNVGHPSKDEWCTPNHIKVYIYTLPCLIVVPTKTSRLDVFLQLSYTNVPPGLAPTSCFPAYWKSSSAVRLF